MYQDIFKFIENNDIHSIKRLLEKDNDLVFETDESEDNNIPLHIACLKGNLEIVKELLKYKGGLQVLIQDKWGKTSLHNTCLKGDLEIVKELLKYKGGLQVLIQDPYGRTSLHYACIEGYLEIAKELLKYGVDQLKLKDGFNTSGEEVLKELLLRQS